MKFLRTQQNTSWESGPPNVETLSIYAVDDAPELTELYTDLLAATGYTVTAFNDRAKALAALTAERKRPHLLIVDYLGHSMPVEQFMRHCRIVHPTVRILMASGLGQIHARFSSVKPDRFIQKPFTAEELLQEVRAAFAA